MTNPRPSSDAEAREEARRILDRVQAPPPGLVQSAMQRAGDHFAAREAAVGDKIELRDVASAGRSGRFFSSC